MAELNELTIQAPADLKHRIGLVAEEQGVSVNQLGMYLFAKEIGRLEAGRKISEYWKGCSEEEMLSGFDAVMAKVKDRPAADWDRAGLIKISHNTESKTASVFVPYV